jgi:hypothetical protein
VVPAVVVGLGVQIQTDNGQLSGNESCQRIDLFGKLIGHNVETAVPREHERDQVLLEWHFRRDRAGMCAARVQKLHLEVRDLLSSQASYFRVAGAGSPGKLPGRVPPADCRVSLVRPKPR